MTKDNEYRVDAFVLWCYSGILRVPWTARRTNTWEWADTQGKHKDVQAETHNPTSSRER